MKKKITKIWGVGLVLVLITSLLAFAAPASAGELSWSTETIPSTTGKVIQTGDVVDIAVAADGTIYAVSGIATLGASAGNTAAWSTAQIKYGSNSALLNYVSGDNAYVEFVPAAGTTVADLATITNTSWWYYASAANGPLLELRFTAATNTDPGGAGHVDINVNTAESSPTTGEWHQETVTSASTVTYFGNDPTDGTSFYNNVGNVPLSAVLASINAQGAMIEPAVDDTADAWVLTRVRVEIGWVGSARTCYIDDVTINGVTYELERGLIYKSTNGGVTWSGLTSPSGADDAQLVAVAPDDSDLVAVAADTKEVYLTNNGGSTWGSLGTVQSGSGVAATALYDLDISADSAGVHYIAAAGTAGSNLPGVYVFNSGAAAPGWTNAALAAAATDWNGAPENVATIDSFRAVKFSPNFASDQVLTAVSEELAAAGGARFHIASFNTKTWDTAAGFPTEYPVSLEAGTVTSVPKAAIALTPEYLGGDDSLRIAFVGASINIGGAEAGGIYRLKDITLADIKAATAVGSIGFDGTNLVAGGWTDTTGAASAGAVYRSSDPLATTPTFSGAAQLKRPGGYSSVTTNVIVAWNGADVVAGTSGDESAFSISRDNGASFNDISLIDTALTNLTDVAVSADGSKVYLATDDDADFSLWRKATTWERVLAIDGKAGFIVRLAPENADAVYAVDKGTTAIYYTTAADTKWFTRTGRYPVQDLAAESASVAYVGVSDAKTVSKSTNSGFTWGTAKSTELVSGIVHSIVSLGVDKVIVGSTLGYVSYSTDGNANWTKISKQLEASALLTQVTASGVATDDYIYAASSLGPNVVRWQIGTSTDWKDLLATANTSYSTYGLVLQDGVLYAASSDGTNSEVIRNLSPTSAAPSTGHWSKMYSAGEAFNAAPQGLRLSSGSTKLWAVDTVSTNELFSFTDTIATAGPTLTTPAEGATVQMNPVSGASYAQALSWSRLSKADAYQVDVALDSAFAQKIKALEPVASTLATLSYVVPAGDLMPGTTYYWRVRVSSTEADTTVYSPFSSPTRTFTVSALKVEPPVVVKTYPPPVITIPPVPPPPQITITPPQIVLPPPPAVPEIVIPAAPTPPAPITPAFIWAIIIIGAILVIALIVLIVRTRRPV